MLYGKMNAVIAEVSGTLAERGELVHTIALALLTRKNLFVLGDPGQAKSQAIDTFRSHIVGAKQFDILMSKGIDQEQLFGRLDLASIIPGNVSNSRLKNDPKYEAMRVQLKQLMDTATTDQEYMELATLQSNMLRYRNAIALYNQGNPEILTEGKIPDSHICFLDELFKANDGVLNSLLKALNERKYTNEGVTMTIPVVSFFSASNEIPNFNNPEEKCLRALYDRFDFKVCTANVEDKDNRMRILVAKRSVKVDTMTATITLQELEQMQAEVKAVKVPASIDVLADNILCELRRKEITVSDRTFFNYAPVVQAQAWLAGRNTVTPADLKALVNYLWNKPEERSVISEVIDTLLTNPLGDKLDALLAKAYALRDTFGSAGDKTKALLDFRGGLVKIYEETEKLRAGLSENDPAITAINSTVATIEGVSKDVHSKTAFTYISMGELAAMKNF